MRPPPALLLVAALLFTCLSGFADAQACSTYTSEQSCYGHRDACHYDLATSTCVTGAPVNATCYQFGRDTIGCAGSTSGSAGLKCQINSAWNNMCYQPPMPCASIVGSDASCQARSDCRVFPSTGNCAVAIAGPSIPANQASSLACTTAGYFWDAYAPGQPGVQNRCYGGGIAEVTSVYPNCGIWSYYGGPAGDPCTSHGCSYDAMTGRCLALPADGGASTGNPSVSLVWSFSLSDRVVDMSNQQLSVTVNVPATQFFNPVRPRWYVVTVGAIPITSSSSPMAPSTCNDLAVSHPAFGINAIAAPTYADTYGMTSYFLSQVQATHNISQFDSGTAIGAAIYQTIGHSKVGFGQSIVQSVIVPSTLDQVSKVVSISLPGAVASCGAPAPTVVANSYTQYNVPFTVTIRDGDNTASSTMNQAVTVSTYGLIAMGSSTKNTVTATVDSQIDTADATAYSAACPVGQKKRVWTIREKWINPNTNTLVGLRNMSDVSMVASGYTQGVGVTLTNCFGTQPVAVIPPTSCTAGICYTLIKFESRCANIPADGTGLSMCVNQLPTNQNTDLGAGGLYSVGAGIPIAAALNGVQSYYHYAHEWTIGNINAAINVGTDPTGVAPDMADVSMTDPVYPDVVSQESLAVDCGFLPTPTSPLSSIVLAASTLGASGSTSAYNIRNMQLASNGALTVACYMRNATLRQSFTVTIDMVTTTPGNLFTISPLNSLGNFPSYAYSTIGYQSIKNEMTYTPRQITTGQTLPIVAAAIGVDAYSLPVYWLQTLLPSVGYLQQFYVSVTLPVPAGSVLAPTVVSRRLLQVGTGPLSSVNSAGAFSVNQDGNSTSSASLLTTDVGSTSSSIKMAAVTVGVVAAGVVVSGVGLAAFLASGATAAVSSSAGAVAVGVAGVVAARARVRDGSSRV